MQEQEGDLMKLGKRTHAFSPKQECVWVIVNGIAVYIKKNDDNPNRQTQC